MLGHHAILWRASPTNEEVEPAAALPPDRETLLALMAEHGTYPAAPVG